MATPNQRFEQSYVQGVGASGALLAAALIAFIAVVGLTSLQLWPESPGARPALSVELPAIGGGSETQSESLASSVPAPLAGAQAGAGSTAATTLGNQSPAAGGRDGEKGVNQKGGRNKGGSGTGINGNGGGGATAPSGTGTDQVTVIAPTRGPNDSTKSGPSKGSGKDKPSHGVNKGNGHGYGNASDNGTDNPGRGNGNNEKSNGKGLAGK
jgi:hypothetical protein